MNIDKLMAGIRKVKPGQYDCKSTDFLAICDASGGGMEAAANCFNFGFLQGRKAERAAAREAEAKKMKGDAPGYALLSALVAKHRKDAKFTRALSSIALSMDTREQRKKTEVPQ